MAPMSSACRTPRACAAVNQDWPSTQTIHPGSGEEAKNKYGRRARAGQESHLKRRRFQVKHILLQNGFRRESEQESGLDDAFLGV